MAKQTPVVGNLFIMVSTIFETVLTCPRSYPFFLIPLLQMVSQSADACLHEYII